MTPALCSSPRGSSQAAARARVLAVEDEAVVALDLCERLRGLGYDVAGTASSAEEAVALAAERRPDLVLMDIRLQGDADGVSAAAEIRRRLDVPVVYLTAHSDQATLARAKVTEPFGYLLKPFEDRELETCIEVALYKHAVESKLRKVERWLAATLKSIGDGVLATDLDGAVLHLNPTAEALTGWPAAEALGRPIGEVFRARSGDAAIASPIADDLVRRVLREGVVVDLEPGTVLVSRDGQVRPIDDSAAPVRDDAGRIVGIVICFRDITERVRAEEALRQSEERARQALKLEAVGRLAGGVAHDFNNLLTAIMGYASLLHGALPTEGEPRQHLAELERAAERAAALTRQLLAFSRKQRLEPRVLDVGAVVADMGRLLRRLLGDDIELVTLRQPGLGAVRADPHQLEQVLMNLAVNARDAMPAGGRLSIEASSVAPDARDLPPGVAPGDVALTVSDTGAGMDEATLAHVFEPFFTTKEVGRGTGLGLATVFGIVSQSGGAITVESAAGRGTTFRVYLPRVHEPPDAPGEPAPAGPLPRGTETVLLAEDSPVVRTLAERLLGSFGYTVLAADGGQTALRLCQEHPGPIHLLLTDVLMPDLDGGQLAERVAGLRPGLRVLYMSGYHEGRPRAELRSEAFIHKPFSAAALARAVRDALDASPRTGHAVSGDGGHAPPR